LLFLLKSVPNVEKFTYLEGHRYLSHFSIDFLLENFEYSGYMYIFLIYPQRSIWKR